MSKSSKKKWPALRADSRFSIPNLTEGLVEELDGFVDVGLGRVQHGGEAQGIAVEAALANEQAVLARALHHLRCSFGSRLLRLGSFTNSSACINPIPRTSPISECFACNS